MSEAITLMERHCDGDGRAFGELYRLLAPRLLAYLTSMIGDRATAEDLLQQSMLKVHRARASYVRGADPVPWVYAIARRTCLDELRRKQRARVRVSLGAEMPELEVGFDGALAGTAPSTDQALLERSLEALATLPPAQRAAVVLTKLEGHSMAEAAVLVGTTTAALKVRAHRGYVALRALLAGPEDSASATMSATMGSAAAAR